MKTAYLVNLKQSSSVIRGSTFPYFSSQSVTYSKGSSFEREESWVGRCSFEEDVKQWH